MSRNKISIYSPQYNKLASKFFGEYVLGKEKENVVISPLSIIVLLAIASDATDGKTRKEIANVLRGLLPYEAAMGIISLIQKELSASGELVLSNAAIVKKSIENSVNPKYKSRLETKFGGELFCTSDIVRDVNSWVKEKTKGMIDQIVDDSMESMLMTLINAVAFEADWENEYDEDDIKEDEFNNADGIKSTVNMMFSKEHLYIENEFFTGFLKPYKGGEYSFMALLPKNARNERIFRRSIERIDFKGLYDSAEYNPVYVNMPEYKGEFRTELAELLMNMGITNIFSPEADFSPLSSEWLKADSIIHKARIEVNRKGTKAAAATAMFLVAGCAPMGNPKSVRLDRPFVYAIMHNETGLPVFTGVTNYISGSVM
ncbi:serpin family protein [Butyrivibrio sp. MC2021]|uniref:serpin family protein n=1 Tax=Butyrivibrio sp. MC2021 TaxID=1408306 RepID=UPI00047E75FD|nr:serpin family protein [Butyrivibrio sp. MC2021]